MTAKIIYSFPIPQALQEKLGAASTVRSMEFHEITIDEEQQASKRARNDLARLSAELTFASFVGVNGVPSSLAEGTLDTVWQGLHPKLRALAASAYNSLHQPTNEEAEGFLKGMVAAAG